MTFSNPAGHASAAAETYVSALLELLGDRDPLGVQEQLGRDLRALVDGLTAQQLQTPEKPGKWSILDVIRHLFHTELVYAYRYRVTVAHDEPMLPGFDQDLWSEQLAFETADVDQLLTRLQAIRSWNLQFLRKLPTEAYSRRGRHEERGWESLDRQIRLGAAHDLVHKKQAARIASAILRAD